MRACRQLLLMVLLVSFASPAFAYIDPNTGGYLYQLLAPLAAIVTSVWMFFTDQVKSLWNLFLGFFGRESER